MEHAKPTIGIIGAGWVGLVSAACFAELGYEVVVQDALPERVKQLEEGEVRIQEPGLTELLETYRRPQQRITYTEEILDITERCDVAFVCVPTPEDLLTGECDLSYVEAVIAELPRPPKRLMLTMKSTVPVGTGARVQSMLEQRDLADVIGYASNPEFLAEGTALEDFRKPDRVVVGAALEEDRQLLASLYEPLGRPVLQMSVESAEATKLVSNAFLVMKISFANEIAEVCDRSGATVDDVTHAMGLDRRIGPLFLRAGLGFGGSCFSKDVKNLRNIRRNLGLPSALLDAALETNQRMLHLPLERALLKLGSLEGKKVALLGLAFKPETNDLRDAPSLAIADDFVAAGAHVVAWDEITIKAAESLQATGRGFAGVLFCEDIYETLVDADYAVIVTEWKCLKMLDLELVARLMNTPVLLDGRNVLDPDAARAAGIDYSGIGRS